MKFETVLSYNDSSSLDEYTQKNWGFSSEFLMAIAAKTFLETYASLLRNPVHHITILCGKGNNGGDGYALAYFLKTENIPFTIYQWENKYSDSALLYKNKLERLGVTIRNLESLLLDIASNHQKTILIDCLLGTGMRLPIDSKLAQLFTDLKGLKKSKNPFIGISLDVVSGRQAFVEFNKEENQNFFPADELAEIGVSKWENLGFPREQKKTLSIGFPVDEFLNTNSEIIRIRSVENLSREKIYSMFSKSKHGHKYSSGAMVAIGGEEGMLGAILLSLNAFVGLGGGIAKGIVFSDTNMLQSLLDNPSLMLKSWTDDVFEDSFTARAKVLVIGPGTTNKSKYKSEILRKADNWCKQDSHRYVILDAGMIPDALEINNGLKFEGNWILTPHFGELQRMTETKINNFQERMIATVNIAKRLNVNILAKDSVSLFVTPKSQVIVWDHPNPKLSTMGTGDILTGILAVSLAKGQNIEEAVVYSLSLMNMSQDITMISPSSWDILEFLKKG